MTVSFVLFLLLDFAHSLLLVFAYAVSPPLYRRGVFSCPSVVVMPLGDIGPAGPPSVRGLLSPPGAAPATQGWEP